MKFFVEYFWNHIPIYGKIYGNMETDYEKLAVAKGLLLHILIVGNRKDERNE